MNLVEVAADARFHIAFLGAIDEPIVTVLQRTIGVYRAFRTFHVVFNDLFKRFGLVPEAFDQAERPVLIPVTVRPVALDGVAEVIRLPVQIAGERSDVPHIRAVGGGAIVRGSREGNSRETEDHQWK
jgi:hypothetical protein